MVDTIETSELVKSQVLGAACSQPNWFLYSLLCYDIWHKMFVAKTLPRRRYQAVLGAE